MYGKKVSWSFCFLVFLVASVGSPAVGGLMLNEFLADSALNDGGGGEWVELYASTTSDLNGYTLTDGDWSLQFQDISIAAGQHLLIGFGSTIDADVSGAPRFLDLEVPGQFSFTGPPMSMTNGGEYLLLQDAGGIAIDGIQWGPSGTASNRNADAAGFFAFSGSSGDAKAYSRSIDGAGVWSVDSVATPGTPNPVNVPEPSSLLLVFTPLGYIAMTKFAKNRLKTSRLKKN